MTATMPEEDTRTEVTHDPAEKCHSTIHGMWKIISFTFGRRTKECPNRATVEVIARCVTCGDEGRSCICDKCLAIAEKMARKGSGNICDACGKDNTMRIVAVLPL